MRLSKAQYQAVVDADEIQLLPLDKLDLSNELQARHQCPDAQGVSALAQSIDQSGLLQNLLVVQAAKGRVEVCAGGRRWSALKLLASQGRIAHNHPVAVRLVPDDAALMISLAENVFREALHPADEFLAFQKLIAQGRSVEDVAAAFSVTPLVVKRRMKLAEVSPQLLLLFRAGEIGLDCLMVLASVDDHARQEQVWAQTPEWQRRPEALRRLLSQDEISGTDPLAQFVGVAAYAQAGGPLRTDLFSNEDEVSLLDGALLEKLAAEKLLPVAEQLRAQGWGWVEVCPRFDAQHYQSHGSLRQTPREPTHQEQSVLDELEKRLAVVHAALDSLDEESEQGETWVNEEDALQAQINALEDSLLEWPADCVPIAGCVVHVGRDAQAAIRRGLIRPQDRSAVQAVQSKAPSEAVNPVVSLPAPHTKPVHSERLVRNLTAHRVAALQAEVVQRPSTALAILAAHLWGQIQCHGVLNFLDVRVTNIHDELPREGSDVGQAKAWLTVEQVNEAWRSRIPTDTQAVLPWLLTQDQSLVCELLSALVAVCIPGVSSSEESTSATKALMQVVDLDMTRWWCPTAEGYLEHVSKARIEAVVEEAVNAQAGRVLRDMKKPEMVAAAEQALVGKGWLPSVLRATPVAANDGSQGECSGEFKVG